MVRTEGLEPPRAFAHQDLNLARLPFPPRPHVPTIGCAIVAWRDEAPGMGAVGWVARESNPEPTD